MTLQTLQLRLADDPKIWVDLHDDKDLIFKKEDFGWKRNTNNELVFFARSSGTTGVHGKAFSYAANSVIFGASLVAYVDATDASQDLLFSSFYFDPADQQQKLATSQVGLEWDLTLE